MLPLLKILVGLGSSVKMFPLLLFNRGKPFVSVSSNKHPGLSAKRLAVLFFPCNPFITYINSIQL